MPHELNWKRQYCLSAQVNQLLSINSDLITPPEQANADHQHKKSAPPNRNAFIIFLTIPSLMKVKAIF